MERFNNAYDFIKAQENPFDYFFMTEDDEYGRFMIINGTIKAFVINDDTVLEAINYWDSIIDIYKIPNNREFFNDNYILVSHRVWTKDIINKYTFIGISNLAVNNPDKPYAINWAQSKSLPIFYYNYSISQKENNYIIKNAANYIMIPPTSHPYIIGMGLAKQFEMRNDEGRECYIIIDRKIKKIKNIHYLRDGDCQKYAVVEV